MGPAQLFVPSSFEAQARLILETVESTEPPDEAWEDANKGSPDED
jgi:hypothetical protein